MLLPAVSLLARPHARLFALGATIVAGLHALVAAMFGWPEVPGGIPVGISVAHGIQWGFSGMLVLLVGALLLGPYRGRTFGQTIRIGAFFLYGAFLAHALFDYRFGGDPVDPALYSASAALVVWCAAFFFDRVLTE